MKHFSRFMALFCALLMLMSSTTAYADWGFGGSSSYTKSADDYTAALQLLQRGDYGNAARAFEALGNFEDATMLTMYCYAMNAGESGLYSIAATNLDTLSGFRDSALQARYYVARGYEAAEMYEEAAEILTSLFYFRDSAERLGRYPELIAARDEARRLAREAAAAAQAAKEAEEAEARLAARYDEAAALEEAGRLADAERAFIRLGEYRDSAERARAIRERIEAEAAAEAERLAAEAEAQRQAQLAVRYAQALLNEASGNLQAALETFVALGDYEDSAERAQAIRERIAAEAEAERQRLAAEAEARRQAELAAAYEAAIALEESGDVIAAQEAFLALEDYLDSAERAAALETPVAYARALALGMSGDLVNAYDAFVALGEYEDSAEKAFLLRIATFAQCDDRGEGVVVFTHDGHKGLFNLNTNTLVSPVWDEVDEFNELGLAKTTRDDLCGYINAQGVEVIPCTWAVVSEFEGDWCTVGTSTANGATLFGVYDKTGAEIIPPLWKALGNSYTASTGTSFCVAPILTGRYTVQNAQGLWGFITAQGEAVGEVCWAEVGTFRNGRCLVKNPAGFRGYIDEQGQPIGEICWAEVGEFANGRCLVKNPAGLYGYINEQGLPLGEVCWAEVGTFADGRCLVKNPEGLLGFINEQGQVLGQVCWAEIGSFADGRCLVKSAEGLLGFINEQGQVLGEVRWTRIGTFADGFAPVQGVDGKRGFINEQGLIVVAPVYDEVTAFSEGLSAVRAGNYWRYVNQSGEVVISARYTQVSPFCDGVALVQLENAGYQIIDQQGAGVYFVYEDMEPRYASAVAQMALGQHENAYATLLTLAGYRDASALAASCEQHIYQKAESLAAQGQYREAADTFALLADYADAPARAQECMTHIEILTVESSGRYGFALNEDGFYESNNKNVGNSTAAAVVTLQSASGKAYVDVIHHAETYFDYGAIYALDSRTNKLVTFNTLEKNTADMQTFEVALPDANQHTLYICYQKDANNNKYNDSMQFRVRFTELEEEAVAEAPVVEEPVVEEPVQAVSSFRVASEGTYGFTQKSNGYYESTNKGKNSTTAACVVTLQSNTGRAYIDVINYAEAGYDYGTIYALDSRSIKLADFSSSSKNTSSVQTIMVTLPDDRPHTLYITFRKDSSTNRNNDSMQFRVRFPSEVIEPFANFTVASEGSYGFAMNANGYYQSQNKGIHSSTAACTVTLRTNTGKAVIDVINYAESGYDYGTIYALDSRSNKLHELKSSSYNKSGVQSFTVDLPDDQPHTLYITFRKDGSGHQNNDTLQFKVRFPEMPGTTAASSAAATPAEPTGAFRVTSEGTYGFALNSNGYYQSQNKGVHSSTAACTVTLKSATRRAYLDVINYAESGYDYGTIYAVDSRSNKLHELKSSSYNKSGVQTFTITLPDTNEHTLYITFKKDGTSSKNNDTLQFKVYFDRTVPEATSAAAAGAASSGSTTQTAAPAAETPLLTVLPNPFVRNGATVVSEGDYGFVLNENGYYESTNKGQHGTVAACTVTLQSANGEAYLDVINYAETEKDFGTIYALDSRTNKRYELKTNRQNKADVQSYTIELPDTQPHTLYITYQKDNSGSRNNDSLQFRFRFVQQEGDVPEARSSFSVANEGSYGFTLKSNGYYESNNKGRHSTTAACTVTLQSNTGRAYIDVINYAEAGYDYGTIYALDSRSNTLVTMSSSSYHKSAVQTFTVNLPDDQPHTLYITFRKDGSGHHNNDTLQFRVRFPEAVDGTGSAPTFSVANEGRYGFTLKSNGYYESNNKAQSSTTAACTVTISGTTRAYLDVINYAEAGCDYGTIYAVDSRTNTLVTMSSSSYNKSSVQTFTINLPDTGEHTLYITFRKASSLNRNNDSLQFRVRFE